MCSQKCGQDMVCSSGDDEGDRKTNAEVVDYGKEKSVELNGKHGNRRPRHGCSVMTGNRFGRQGDRKQSHRARQHKLVATSNV